MSGIWGNFTSGIGRMTSNASNNNNPSASSSRNTSTSSRGPTSPSGSGWTSNNPFRPVPPRSAQPAAHKPSASQSSSPTGQAPGQLPEHLDPPKALFEMLHALPNKFRLKYDAQTKYYIMRFLYNSVFAKAEWIPYVLGDGEAEVPLPRDQEKWVWQDDRKEEFMYSLAEVQREIDRKRKAKGKQLFREVQRGKMCGKTLHRGDRTYTCKTCAIDASCILCVDCFQESDHEGHEVLYSQSFSFAASCDCGDPSAWRSDQHLGCKTHPRASGPGSSFDTNAPTQPLTKYDIPPALINCLYQCIVISLEFLITALQFAPLPSENGNLPEHQLQMQEPEDVTGLPRAERGKGPWTVTIHADDKHTLKELARQIRDGTGIDIERATRAARAIDEDGRRTIITTTNPMLGFHVASMIQQIDVGVNLRPAFDVFREEMAAVLIYWLQDMIECSIGPDSDLFGKLLWRALNEPRRDNGMNEGTGLPLDLAEIGYTHGFNARRIDWLILQDLRLWKKAKWQWRAIYSRLYCINWDIRKELACRFSANYVRLYEQFLFQDREVDTGLLFCVGYILFGNGKACAYASEKTGLLDTLFDVAQAWFTAQIYNGKLSIPPRDIDRSDPSPERRLLSEELPAFRGKKGVTLFSHLRSLMRHEEMQRFIALNPRIFHRAVQFINIFVGLQTQKKEVLEHVEFEIDWTRTFTYLGDLSKFCKELGESLKYAAATTNKEKNDGSIIFGNLIDVGSRVLNDIHLKSNILDPIKYRRLEYHYVHNVLLPGSNALLIKMDISFMEAFSFHHYMNLLFAECLKSLSYLTWRKTERRIGSDIVEEVNVHDVVIDGNIYQDVTPGSLIKEFLPRHSRDSLVGDGDKGEMLDVLALFEFPLQKHVVISQIRADLWRKNGAGMRGQSHHYRDISVRDATLDQEFFSLQVGMCTVPTHTFISAIIDRYGLSAFFSGDLADADVWAHELIEPKQYVQLIEDFLLLCINLATDTTMINLWDQDRITRKHIIQQLGLGTLMYSEIIKKLPERTVESSLAPYLSELADFREPTETSPGAYTLKAEFVEEIDPYWHHYSRNDQRKAIDRILENRKKQKNDDPLILPPKLEKPKEDGPWYNLHHWLGGEVANSIVNFCLALCGPIAKPESFAGYDYIRPVGDNLTIPSLELLLELTLQFAMIIADYDIVAFANCSVRFNRISNALSVFQQLLLMLDTDAFQPWRPKVEYLLDKIVKNAPEEHAEDYRKQKQFMEDHRRKNSPKVDPKIAAAQRQKAIMADFAKKQAKFAAHLLDGIDDEDDDEFDDDLDMNNQAPIEQGKKYGSCIVCQEEVTDQHTGGMLALFQPSRILRECVHDRDWFDESLICPTSMDQSTRQYRYGLGTTGEPSSTEAYPAANHKFGVFISACTHLMHETCMANYFDATRYRHTQQVQRHHPENAVRFEYLCPLCKSLGNMLVPLDPSLAVLKPYVPANGKLPSLTDKIREVSSEGLLKVRDSAKIWDHHVETGELNPWFSDCNFHSVSLDPGFRKQIRTTAKMVERFRALIRPLSEQSQRIRNRKTHMYVPDEVVAYTINCTEIAQRGIATTGQSVAEGISETSSKLIKQMINLLQLELDMYFGPKWDRSALRVGIFARFLPDWYRASTLPSPLLLRNAFVLVIETAAIAPDLLHTVMTLGYYSELTRAMLGLAMWIKRCLGPRTTPSKRPDPPQDPWLNDALDVFKGFKPIMQAMLRNNAGPFTDADSVLGLLSEEHLSKLMYSQTLPYLRRCAILYHSLTGKYPSSFTPDPPTIDPGMCEYKKLLKLLVIPEPVLTLSNPSATETPIVGRWLSQWAIQGRIVPTLEYPGTYELIRLPEKWEDLLNYYNDKKCVVCNTKPSLPAICLFCGKMVCLAGDCCSVDEQGEANYHMRECGAVVGLYADLKRWLIVYLFAGSGSFGNMPYLDSHGELDMQLRRSHRQYMHPGRMEELRRGIWLQHTVPHLTARKLELTTDGGGWGTL